MNPTASNAARTAAGNVRHRRTGAAAITLGTIGVSVLGALASAGDADPWYQTLDKAPGTPPGFVFGIVWPVLYLLMIVSAIMVWFRAERTPDAANWPITLFGCQLGLNLAWSWLFFGLHQPVLALVDIAALIVLVALMIRAFHTVRPAAAWLQAPYIAWLCFAAYLNGWVVFAN